MREGGERGSRGQEGGGEWLGWLVDRSEIVGWQVWVRGRKEQCALQIVGCCGLKEGWLVAGGGYMGGLRRLHICNARWLSYGERMHIVVVRPRRTTGVLLARPVPSSPPPAPPPAPPPLTAACAAAHCAGRAQTTAAHCPGPGRGCTHMQHRAPSPPRATPPRCLPQWRRAPRPAGWHWSR